MRAIVHHIRSREGSSKQSASFVTPFRADYRNDADSIAQYASFEKEAWQENFKRSPLGQVKARSRFDKLKASWSASVSMSLFAPGLCRFAHRK